MEQEQIRKGRVQREKVLRKAGGGEGGREGEREGVEKEMNEGGGGMVRRDGE